MFLVLFTSIRLLRIYLVESFLENSSNIDVFSEVIIKYNIYIIGAIILLGLGSLYLLKLIFFKICTYISVNLKINIHYLGTILLGISASVLLTFIIYEFYHDYSKISKSLFRIFTLYLGLYAIVKILIYSYKISFDSGQSYYKDIRSIHKNDVIDISWKKKVVGKYLNIDFLRSQNVPLSKKIINKIKKVKVKQFLATNDFTILKDTYSTLDTVRKIYDKNDQAYRLGSVRHLLSEGISFLVSL